MTIYIILTKKETNYDKFISFKTFSLSILANKGSGLFSLIPGSIPLKSPIEFICLFSVFNCLNILSAVSGK